MNRIRIAANSRDAALRAQYKKLQDSLIAQETAKKEAKAEEAAAAAATAADTPAAETETAIAEDVTE
jgi:DNA-directed RNA polymerase subunit beta'